MLLRSQLIMFKMYMHKDTSAPVFVLNIPDSKLKAHALIPSPH